MKGMTVLMAVALVMAMVIYMRHLDNIRRLASGQESRIGKKNR
jgi:glycerol-3-phosphate acyltransferase PlsY